MFWIGGFVVSVLVAIAWQDFKFRAVYWWLFLLLFSGLWTISLLEVGFPLAAERMLYNCAFVLLQVFLLSLYFAVKNRRWLNIFDGYFGLGDLCFLLAVSVYFSLTHYLFFYVLSLLFVVLISGIIRLASPEVNLKIPLAGYQALCLICLLITGFFFPVQAWLLSLGI
ncbi:hypothetical protein QWY86_15570 [Pedobacter aquatilis]|uniref:hypothetical protein n=1 Tax=Pedobacter aquatilis TaxID=351343 RepID=UPI0025B31AC9|nr:hypothetical protein [Pedobacter aquatilis]MDN3588102.1 hypothetical protein [Pedobacter aquatilis]